jgi:hypothetical protein
MSRVLKIVAGELLSTQSTTSGRLTKLWLDWNQGIFQERRIAMAFAPQRLSMK